MNKRDWGYNFNLRVSRLNIKRVNINSWASGLLNIKSSNLVNKNLNNIEDCKRFVKFHCKFNLPKNFK